MFQHPTTLFVYLSHIQLCNNYLLAYSSYQLTSFKSSRIVCLLRLLVKHNALQFSFLSSSRLFRGFGIVNRYSRLLKSLNMADRDGEFSFFLGIHVRIDISISIRPMSIKFGRQVYLQELTQMRLIMQVLMTPSGQDHVTLKRCNNFFSARAIITIFGLRIKACVRYLYQIFYFFTKW